MTDWVTNSTDNERPLEGNNRIQLLANYLSLYNLEAAVRHQSGSDKQVHESIKSEIDRDWSVVVTYSTYILIFDCYLKASKFRLKSTFLITKKLFTEQVFLTHNMNLSKWYDSCTNCMNKSFHAQHNILSYFLLYYMIILIFYFYFLLSIFTT